MSLPTEPYSRIERYLAKLAGQDVDIPDRPITRIECYLAYLCENGGGGGGGGYTPAPNAGAHNGIFRGQSLGTEFTADQLAAIVGGTFEDMYIGDYWTLNNTVYRIAGFDIFLNTGNVIFTDHHAVIVPDGALGTGSMNETNTAEGGYAGSLMKTSGLTAPLAKITSDFGEGHILTRRSKLCTGVGASAPSSWAWSDTAIDLMTEGQVLGRGAWGTQSQNAYNIGERYSRFPLFSLCPSYVNITSGSRATYWLQDIRTTTGFTCVYNDGSVNEAPASTTLSIRPYFCIGERAS